MTRQQYFDETVHERTDLPVQTDVFCILREMVNWELPDQECQNMTKQYTACEAVLEIIERSGKNYRLSDLIPIATWINSWR